ncbi:MAG: hypothetical protein IT437_03285 [Phycisphaerales bacterium]|nr:hypothetical protein [Phycisphaerales bacterium]
MDTNPPDNPAPGTPDAPATAPTGGDVLSVISDVERRLLQLRDAHMETERARTRVENLERELTRRASDAAEQARNATAELEAARAQRQQATAEAAELERERAEVIGERERIAGELAAGKRTISDGLAALTAREKTLDEREASLAEREGAIARDHAAAEQMAAELVQQQEEARRAGSDLAARLQEAQRDADSGRQAVERLSREAEELRTSHAVSAEAVAALRAQLEEATRDAARARSDSESGASALRTQLAQAMERAGALDADLHAARQACAAGEAQARATEDLLHGAESQQKQLAETVELRSAEARKQGELAARLRRDCDKHEANLKRLDEERAALGTEVVALKAQTAALGTEAASLKAQTAALGTEAASLKAQTAALGTEVAALKSQAAERAQELAGTSQLLEKSRASGQRLEAENSRLTTSLEKASVQEQLLQQLLDESRAEAAQLKSRVQESASIAQQARDRAVELQHVPPDIRVQTRRRRMELVRRLLREQQGKLRTAGDALRERFRECEQILARREELAAARAAMVEVQRKLDRVQGKAVRTRAANLTLAIVALLGLLGGISWGITTQVAPATYAVKAVIEADGRGRELTEQELAEWRKFHENLISDPAMMQAAAQRMSSRGITSLGTPGLLSARLKKDLHHEAREDRLELELVGLGAARTCREMETFVTALVSQSNAGRDRRSDGVATIITTTADPGPGPIDDERPAYAAVVFASTALISGLLGFGLWRRLAAAKTRFEEESQIDAAIDEANWGAAATFRPR